MFSEVDVKALLRDRRLKPPVASLYLNTDRTYPEGEKYLATFRHLVHEADRLLTRRTDPRSAVARERLGDIVPQLLAFLDQDVASQSIVRGSAFFVSLAERADVEPRSPAFTAYTLPRPVRSQARVDQRPYIRPLLFLLDQYERVGVIAADRKHGWIFTLFLGELEQMLHRVADTPPHHKRGGWKQMLFQRDADGHMRAHVRKTVRDALRLFRSRPLKRLVLGGTEETLTSIQRELPPQVRKTVAGTFHLEAHASDRDLVTRALGLAQQAERAEETRHVDELREMLAGPAAMPWGGGTRRAVAGLAETLASLAEHRVQQLVVRRGYRAPGSLCQNCGVLSPLTGRSSCPACAEPLQVVSDVVEHAVERASEQRADIEFVAESSTLDALGHIGALLRF